MVATRGRNKRNKTQPNFGDDEVKEAKNVSAKGKKLDQPDKENPTSAVPVKRSRSRLRIRKSDSADDNNKQEEEEVSTKKKLTQRSTRKAAAAAAVAKSDPDKKEIVSSASTRSSTSRKRSSLPESDNDGDNNEEGQEVVEIKTEGSAKAELDDTTTASWKKSVNNDNEEPSPMILGDESDDITDVKEKSTTTDETKERVTMETTTEEEEGEESADDSSSSWDIKPSSTTTSPKSDDESPVSMPTLLASDSNEFKSDGSTKKLQLDSNSNKSRSICDSSDDDDDDDNKESPKRKPTNDPPSSQPSQKKTVLTFDSSLSPFSSSSSNGNANRRCPLTTMTKRKTIAALPDDSDSDVSEDELKSKIAKLMTMRRNTTDSLGDSSDESDSDDSFVEAPRQRRCQVPVYSSAKKKKGPPAASAFAASTETKALKEVEVSVEPLPMLSAAEKEVELSKIENEADRNLQRLLWSLGVRYTLLSYQFKGVRSLTGVNDDFPSLVSRTNFTSNEWKKLLRDTQMADQQHQNNNHADDDDDKNYNNKTRGILMADVMGLGKTVQAVVACILRNLIAKEQGRPGKPTILVSPNHAVSKQWAETLVKAGVPFQNVRDFVPRKGTTYAQLWHRNSDIYLLLNRYQLQTETKHLFSEIPEHFRPNMRRDNEYKSPLFPAAIRQLVFNLKNQYLSAQGKAQNLHRQDGEYPAACVTRLLSYGMRGEKVFRSLVIDEAHFLKNLLSYWGMGAALLGLHVERCIPMTGTPYNNSAQDIATLMTFIDPSLHSSYESWWKKATQDKAPVSVARAVKEWNESYMVRREKKVLGDRLKRKIIVNKDVPPIPLELHVYEGYESAFLSMLENFKGLADDYSPIAMAQKKELFKHMISLAALMRMALIHPVMPGGGRDYTINYSPTRRHLSGNLCNQKRCVCCRFCPETNLTKKKKKTSATIRDAVLENLGDDQLMGDDESDTEDEIYDIEKGELIELPVEYCSLPNIREGGLRHYVHEDCFEAMAGTCPLCSDLCSRAEMNSGMESLLSNMKEAVPRKDVKPDDLTSKSDVEDLNMKARALYCKDLVPGLCGFRGSAKIECIISDFRKIPDGEKVLMLSFFKSSLDLVEGILHYELGINYARFDGDFSAETRQEELDRFKSEPSCKVLLMTVQTGGTGLNIVEANHCMFIDRWFNPFVHEQAEDRLYRLGQKRDVNVTYYDISYTIDQCMHVLNDVKLTNASIVLADGQTTLSMASSGLSYKEMGGLLGNSVRAVRSARIKNVLARTNGMIDAPMVPTPDFASRLLAGEQVIDPVSGFISQRAHSPFTRIGDALMHILGYTRAAAAAALQTGTEKKSGNLSDELDSDNEEEEEDDDEKKPAAVASMPRPSSTVPASVPDIKSEAVPSTGNSTKPKPKGSSNRLDMIELSSDDDSLSSIPGPVFKKSVKKE